MEDPDNAWQLWEDDPELAQAVAEKAAVELRRIMKPVRYKRIDYDDAHDCD